jgi:hypothetical protein
LGFNLFDIIVDEDTLHPYFKEIKNEPAYAKTHVIINEWGKGLLGRYGETKKFIKEFQTTFNSSFWELYLNKAFRDLGYDIDYSKSSPDFNIIGKNNRRISVEAVTSNPASTPTLILEASDTPEKDFLNESTLKLTGKIRDKLILYVGNGKKKHPYSSLPHVENNPFVIALAPFDKKLSQSQNNTVINRVLYGLEPPTSPHEPQKSVKYILNRNEKSVDLGIFTNDSFKEISAVIFSTTGTFGKAVALARTAEFITVTRLRKMGIVEFMAKEGLEKIGKSRAQLSESWDIFSQREVFGSNVFGHDVHLCSASEHKESHLDGLQIYHNPFSIHPLLADDFNAKEIVHYYYEIESGTMSIKYNDNAMVSRKAFTGTIGA